MADPTYKTVVTVVILSEEHPGRIDGEILARMLRDCVDGDLVLHSLKSEIVETDEPTMRKLLIESGSDEEFFFPPPQEG